MSDATYTIHVRRPGDAENDVHVQLGEAGALAKLAELGIAEPRLPAHPRYPYTHGIGDTAVVVERTA